jgi:hypothetical protein
MGILDQLLNRNAMLSLGPRAVREVSGDAATVLSKRLPPVPKSYPMMPELATDPLQVVLARYGEHADEALARARLAQAESPLQYLETDPGDGRWVANRQAGVTGYEIPLLTFPGSKIPGTESALGSFRFTTRSPLASIQMALGQTGDVLDVLDEEALHAIDRNVAQKASDGVFSAPRSFARQASGRGLDQARRDFNYYSIPGETRATLSQLLPKDGRFIETEQDAYDLLERALETGDVRQAATAEAIQNSKRLRNQYIPYLRKALSAGGVFAGNELTDEGDAAAFRLR